MSAHLDRNRSHRRSIRLNKFNYTQQGAYVITICTRARTCLFGDVADGTMQLNTVGQVAARCWRAIPDHFSDVALDEWVVMPNHVHGIVVINDAVGGKAAAIERFGKPVTESVPTIVRSFKSAVTKNINATRGTLSQAVWQRNYYEHVIRNDVTLGRIRQYITENPARWAEDPENPARHDTHA